MCGGFAFVRTVIKSDPQSATLKERPEKGDLKNVIEKRQVGLVHIPSKMGMRHQFFGTNTLNRPNVYQRNADPE